MVFCLVLWMSNLYITQRQQTTWWRNNRLHCPVQEATGHSSTALLPQAGLLVSYRSFWSVPVSLFLTFQTHDKTHTCKRILGHFHKGANKQRYESRKMSLCFVISPFQPSLRERMCSTFHALADYTMFNSFLPKPNGTQKYLEWDVQYQKLCIVKVVKGCRHWETFHCHLSL